MVRTSRSCKLRRRNSCSERLNWLGDCELCCATYNSMVVKKLGAASEEIARPRLPTVTVRAFDAASLQAAGMSPVVRADCETRMHKQKSPKSGTGAAELFPPPLRARQAVPAPMVSAVPAPTVSAVPAPTIQYQYPVGLPASASMPGLQRVVSYPQRFDAKTRQSPVLLGRPGGYSAPLASISEVAKYKTGSASKA